MYYTGDEISRKQKYYTSDEVKSSEECNIPLRNNKCDPQRARGGVPALRHAKGERLAAAAVLNPSRHLQP